jgi:hypothetical protein
LDGRLWHATDEQGWNAIRLAGAIVPGARINFPNAFCRSISAVSLFDLAQPDSAASRASTHWSAWLGAHPPERRFWLEVDRAKAAPCLLSPAETLERWRSALAEGSPSLRLIAGLEAAHVGRIPLEHTVRTIEVNTGRWIA